MKSAATTKNIAAVAAAPATGGASLSFLDLQKPIQKLFGTQQAVTPAQDGFSAAIANPVAGSSPIYFDPRAEIIQQDNVTFVSDIQNRGIYAITKVK